LYGLTARGHNVAMNFIRRAHRWVGFLASAFLALIAGTGVYMQTDTLVRAYFPPVSSPPEVLPQAEVPALIRNALYGIGRIAPGRPVASLNLQMLEQHPRATITLAVPHSRSFLFDARTGEPLAVVGAGDGQSLRQRLWIVMVKLHRGDLIGPAGNWLGLVSGLALLALATTGLLTYAQLYRQRRKLRRHSLLW
jgi:uncharacterized iron-regulated membrane protein